MSDVNRAAEKREAEERWAYENVFRGDWRFADFQEWLSTRSVMEG